MDRIRNPLPQLIPQRVHKTRARVEALLWNRLDDLAVVGGPVNEVAVPVARAGQQPLRKVKPGEYFGPANGGWGQRWFRVEIPAPQAGEKGRRHLHWQCVGETTAFIDGEPWAGFDSAHRTCPLPDRACTVWLDCGTYNTGIWAPSFEAPNRFGIRFDWARLGVRDAAAWKAFWDLDACIQLMTFHLKDGGWTGTGGFGHLPALERIPPYVRVLLRGLDEACDAFNDGGPAALGAALDGLMERLPAESWQPVAALVGHAHIDLVWLWPESATERKGIHTFATQLRLMERYPEYRFSQSQPALTRAIERLAPNQAKAIRKRIAEGRWEAMGGFEVEPDNNLPSGEALARSLAIGQRKFAELRGGSLSTLCWIPDVFGYSCMLPQILALGGVTGFFTTKMTWSAVTRFPYTSFVWRGADGSEVLTHLCSTGYNGNVEAENLVTALREHRQADVHPELLLPQGYGDGGGGATEAMCERARRFADLAGAPRTRWTSGEEFFARLDKRRARLPVYQGELYLEYHRGTYTTQSEFKRLYRAAERGLQAHEAVRVATRGKPLDERAWQRVAFAQFHDAIPGSSIGLVYAQLNPELERIGADALDAARSELAATGAHAGLLAFNPLPLPRTVVVELPADGAVGVHTPDGLALPVQRLGTGKRARLLAAVSLPGLGAERLLPVADGDQPRTSTWRKAVGAVREASAGVLDNGLVRAEFDGDGQLAALTVDGQAVALSGRAGFALYDDHPANFDAWDIDHYSLGQGQRVATALRLSVIERGPVRAVLRGEAAIGAASRLVVDYVLEAGSRWLGIEARIAWAEDHRLLKFHLVTAYRGRWARFGTPFGSIQRPQQPGTEREEAQWEVPGSRWAAVTAEDGTGAAIITEAKFGFSCRDGDLGLSLLRAPSDPDKNADRGDHRIRFAVGRHRAAAGGDAPCTAAAADLVFAPVVTVPGGKLAPPLLALEDLGSLVPSWVLPAADGDGWILRLHETAGAAGTATLHLQQTPRSVDLVDFLERRLGKPEKFGPRTWTLAYRPYQILSVRVR
jgi:alpha-mannosidase